MAGCFGNDPEDRARERELNNYLDATYGDANEAPEQDWDAIRKQRIEEELVNGID